MVDTVNLTDVTFGRCELRPAARELRVDGAPVKVGARAFDLLCVLVDRRDRVIPKNELLERVWPDLVVEENNLQVQVSALRKLIGASAIATVPGRGYRFTAELQADAPHASGTPSPVAPSPPKTSPPSAPPAGNLPRDAMALYGRDVDLEQLDRLLTTHRLVTLVGPGGVGKTRLAQAAARRAARRHPDGVWMVDLAAVTDPARVLGSVARSVDVPLPDHADADELARRLAGRDELIVLDNCEHLIDAASVLADALIRGAPHLRLLATSQAPLKIAGEQLHRVEPLALDGLSPALQLFEARARAVQPWFQLDDARRDDVADICRRLDGIPLAIELAAARVPLLGVDGLRQRLDQRFRLLTASPRNAPQRQQTLHAALAWSHALLDPLEQRVFRRLARFLGGFSLPLAQQVGADKHDDEWAVLDALGALVDRSLVVADPGPTPRYRLLESARAFALERLCEAQEQERTAEALADALLAQLEPAMPRWYRGLGADREELQAMTVELDNLRAALEWSAADPARTPLMLNLVGVGHWMWKPAGAATEGLQWSRRALAALAPDTPPRVEARVLFGFACSSHLHQADAEIDALRRAANLYARLDDREGRYQAWVLAAQKLCWCGKLADAERAIAAAQALWDPDWPPTMREGLLTARTYAFEAGGRPEAGEPLMEELVALMQAHGSRDQLDVAQLQLAESLFVQGKARESVALRREVAERADGRRSAYTAGNLGNLSAALTYLGDIDEALAIGRRAAPLLQRQNELGCHLVHFALLACRRGRPDAGAAALGRAEALRRATGFDHELSERRASDMALAALAEALTPAQLEARMREGEVLSDAQLLKLTLGD